MVFLDFRLREPAKRPHQLQVHFLNLPPEKPEKFGNVQNTKQLIAVFVNM
jgi:hypothetical protein